MDRDLLRRPSFVPDQAAAPTLAQLDDAFDRELVRACALVERSGHPCARVVLVGDVGGCSPDQFWVACNARAAELATMYGVEMLLVVEGSAMSIRVEPHDARADAAIVAGPAPRSRCMWPWQSRHRCVQQRAAHATSGWRGNDRHG